MSAWRRVLRAGMMASALWCAACESTPKEPIAPAPTKSKQAAPSSAGSTRTSKPIAPTNKKPTAKESPSATTKPGKPAPATADATKRAEKGGTLPPPSYAEIAKAYNARTARLQRVWARAVVSVDFTDEEGNRRWEQGEGHFQVIQPSKMALSAGKLGEVMLWIGCDTDRYWFIDAKEKHRGWVGRHSAASREKIESLGMPAAPRDLLALAGITPLPRPSSDKKRDPVVRWSVDRRALMFDSDRAGARWRYFIDPKTYEPTRVEVIDAKTSEPILSATLEQYDNLKVRGDGSIPPRIATRFRCLHHPSGSTLGLSIADMVDGGTNKLRDQNFDFDALHELLGIRDVVDLDVKRPAAARANPAGGE